jgi:hypothetical protein
VTYLNLNAVRCEALFASTLQPSEDANPQRVAAIIMATIRNFGSRGCAARVAQEFGDHPETAIHRMRWARTVVDTVYGVDQIRVRPQPHRPSLMSPKRLQRADQTPERRAAQG